MHRSFHPASLASSDVGTLTYGTIQQCFDDAVLWHLEVFIGNKLRRREPFMLQWHDAERGGGTTSVWISTGIPLVFRYDASGHPPLDRAWMQHQNQSCLTSGVLRLGHGDTDLEPLPR